MDTPGSSEAGERQLQGIANFSLHSAAALIFIMKYDDIKNKEDYDALRAIKERDPGH